MTNKTIEISEELYQKLKEMAHEVATQDNLCTAKPITHEVHRPVAHYSRDPDGVGCGSEVVYYFDTEFYERDEILARLDKPEEAFEYDDEMDEWLEQQEVDKMYRWYENEMYDHCGTFLTCKGALAFIESNRHHVGQEAFVFVNHAWRNKDAETIQELMEALANDE